MLICVNVCECVCVCVCVAISSAVVCIHDPAVKTSISGQGNRIFKPGCDTSTFLYLPYCVYLCIIYIDDYNLTYV